ncbi:MAG: VOC family protein, partial [Polyangiales bacterium]
AIESGALLATGGIGKRATSAARVAKKDGKITVEDPPAGDGWMAGGGYSLTEFATKEEAIENAKKTLEFMNEAVIELIQVSEMHPPPKSMPLGVVPYLSIDGAAEASAFYQRAFGAKELARMVAQDGKRLMHCHLEINGGGLMLSDYFPEMGSPPVQRSDSYTLQLVVADGDAWWSRAIEAGCKEKLPFAVAPWGDKYGQLTDPFGVTWAINSPAKRER